MPDLRKIGKKSTLGSDFLGKLPILQYILSGIKGNIGLLSIAFLEGAFVMALELSGARFFAPFYGSSILVWTIVLTMVVTALAIGYFIGGKLARRENPDQVFAAIAIVVALVSAVSPWWANLVCGWFENSIYYVGVSMSALLVLLLPNMLFGTIPPMLIELLSRNSMEAGRSSGTVYGVSTVGGILGTFIFGFYLIPEYGLTSPLVVFSILFSLVIVRVFWSIISIKKVLLIPVGVLFVLFFLSNSKRPDRVVKYHSEGLLGQVMVADVQNQFTKGTDRVLFVNRMGQTWMDKKSGLSMWSYPHYINTITSIYPRKSDVLLLGLGGGTIARNLEKQLGFNVDVVELDERIKMVSRKYFSYNTGNVVVDDARHYLRKSKKQYDIVVFDVFKGEVAPSYVLTLESFKELKNRLKPGGMILINFGGFLTGDIGKPGRSVFKTLKRAGCYVYLIPTEGAEKYRNVLFAASFDPLTFEKPRFQINLKSGKKSPLDLIVSSDSLDLDDAVILSDDLPNLEILNIQASQSWRKDYKETFADKLPKEEVPMFK